MSKLLPIFIFSVVLALCSHLFSDYDYENNNYIRKEKALWIIITVFMVFFVGLRVGYNDTFAYRWNYEQYVKTGFDFSEINWTLGANPGFNATNVILKSLGFSVQSFLLFYAAITIIPYMWFLRKYSTNFPLSVFLFFTMGCFTFCLAAIKQCVAMAFCLIAVDRAFNRKYFRFVFWIFLASTFHPYALLYLVAPFMYFKPWGWQTWAVIIGFGIIGIFLQPLMGVIIDITTMLGEEYTAEQFSRAGVNVGRLAVVSVPVILGFLVRKPISEEEMNVQMVMYNFTVFNAVIMFIALFGTANYFARLANYFLVFQVFSLPWLFQFFESKSKNFLVSMMIVCYVFYFYYSNAINQSFDGNFSNISFFSYLKSILS